MYSIRNLDVPGSRARRITVQPMTGYPLQDSFKGTFRVQGSGFQDTCIVECRVSVPRPPKGSRK